MAKLPTKISELVPDDKNFNKGSEFGNSLIEKSFRKFGAGRSILIDKNNRIIVPILPFSKIDEMGAGMYKGKKITFAERKLQAIEA